MALRSHARRTFSDHSDFPCTLSWSASPETTKTLTSYTQHVPNDVLRYDDLDTILPGPIAVLATILDRTTLDVDFDHSCLDGLEDELLYSPIDVFEAMCWQTATDEEVEPPPRHSLRKSRVVEQNGAEEEAPSDESGSDTDECRTFNDDIGGFPTPNPEANVTRLPLVDTKSHFNYSYYTSFDVSRQIFAFEQRFSNFGPADSIGLSPVPPHLDKKAKTGRFTALRAHLPLRRKKSTPAT